MRAVSASRLAWRFIGGLVLVGGIAIVYLASRPPTPRQVLERCLFDVLEGDGEDLIAFLRPEELEASKMSPESFQRFLTSFVQPKLKAFSTAGPIVFEEFPNQAAVLGTVRLKGSEGRESSLSFVVQESDEGPRLRNVFMPLVLCCAFADWQYGSPLPRGEMRVRHLSKMAEQYGPELNAIGVRGIAYPGSPDASNFVYMTWHALAERFKRKAEESQRE